MADFGEPTSVEPFPKLEAARRKIGTRIRNTAPKWLRALGVFALVRAAAIIAIAWFWIDHRDESLSDVVMVLWAVCGVTFELLAAITLLVSARVRMPWGVALGLTILAFGALLAALVAFVAAALFSAAPEWAAYVGVLDNMARIPLMVGMMWPVILAIANAIDGRSSARRG